MRNRDLVYSLFSEKTDYFLRWYHPKPLLITLGRRDELRRMHALLYKCICHLAEHYRDYVDKYMPLSEKEMEILDYQSRKPFKAGAYRPDYIVSERGDLLLVEITCRFFGHGIWHGYPAFYAADKFMEAFPSEVNECVYDDLLEYMKDYVPDGRDIVVLKSSDKTNEIAMYSKFWDVFGHKTTVLEADQVEPCSALWRQNAFVISALNQDDLMSYSMDTLKAMVDADMVNDFRTILLAHDKRFLRLIFIDEFSSACLTPEETAFLRSHTIETFVYPGADADAHALANAWRWKDALENKDAYIIKPYNLGKSVGLHAGCMCSPEQWEEIFRSDLHSMILQPFITQKRFPLVWEGTPYQDYICGMMLCVDDKYFDSGLVRCSSAPVTNKVDDRKKAIIHSDSLLLREYCDLL